ncbi:hypothetical protein LI328DRAFT_4408 [Trichoderma asperelloides]|nr:hypothetical protein LI328DRAFT_4408 [Trichoderma asperelloides]
MRVYAGLALGLGVRVCVCVCVVWPVWGRAALVLQPFQKENIIRKKKKLSGSYIEQEWFAWSSMLQSDPQPCSLCHRLSSLHHVGSVIYLWKREVRGRGTALAIGLLDMHLRTGAILAANKVGSHVDGWNWVRVGTSTEVRW